MPTQHALCAQVFPPDSIIAIAAIEQDLRPDWSPCALLSASATCCAVTVSQGHCHVGQFYLSMARRAYGPHTAKSMACRVREWRWTPRESAILGRRDNAFLCATAARGCLFALSLAWCLRESARTKSA